MLRDIKLRAPRTLKYASGDAADRVEVPARLAPSFRRNRPRPDACHGGPERDAGFLLRRRAIPCARCGDSARARDRGATIINDVTGLSNPRMARLASKARAGVVVMHMQGDPATMQQAPRYTNVAEEVRDFLAARAKAAMAVGIEREAIAVDPGIGFGKTVDHNLDLLRNLERIASLGHPVVVGVSRKSFIAHLGGGERMEDRLAGSVAAATLAAARGADVIRAHDVTETVRAMRVANGVLRGRANL